MTGQSTLLDPKLREQRILQCTGKLSVHKNGLPGKTREYVITSGLGPAHNYGVYHNNVDTIERAFTERYFLCKDGEGFRPAFKVQHSAYDIPELVAFRKAVVSHTKYLPTVPLDLVVEAYSGPKKRVYAAALDSLKKKELTQRDATLSSFVKFEKQDDTKAPRVINPRDARYNLELARYLKLAEHKIFKSINKAWGARTRATVIKGYNADVSAAILRDKWDKFVHPVAIGLDASKFDMHVSKRALQYEHSFYTSLFPGDKRLATLLKWQLHNKGVAYAADGKVKFSMEGTRSSGDLNTSLGNCIIMCACLHAYCAQRGVRAELANNGDDCVLIIEAADETRIQDGLGDWFRKRGFSMTVEPTVDEFEQIEFCQTRPVQLSTGWRMIRNVSAVVRKDPMCLQPIPNERAMMKWWGAVGECGTTLNSGVPVLSNFYAVMQRAGVDTTDAYKHEVFRNRSTLHQMRGVKAAEVDARARVSFYYAFGYTPDEQRELERYYDSMELTWRQTTPLPKDCCQFGPGPLLIQ